MSQDWVIDVSGLTKRFAGRTVVDQLGMQVSAGEIYGFLGPNGSGKTTSIRMLCGLLTPDAGAGHTLGYDIVHQAAQIKAQVGYMTQRFGLYEDLTLEENLLFVARLYGMDNIRQRVTGCLEQLGLGGRRKQLAGTLSGGWKQRLALAACMLHQPRLLLLDEPTAGVDPKARRDFWEEIHALAATGITVLVSTHYMDEAERCHRLGYIAYGKLLVHGTPAALLAQHGLTTWQVSGDTRQVFAALDGHPDIPLITRFGNTLHLCSHHAERLQQAIAPWINRPDCQWQPLAPQLEDLFISLMQQHSDPQAHPGGQA